ncbi:SDR family NAD(P)-dependent oxidoreductase [uncultured Sphaerochaeta sp.]|uniref:SDR family NAD(P)-dependent oxidoreductase n=1 Tax=uncultured Sphaerochaeta sp. TaxID=886478 RepID=UPI002AA68CB6|nr:SDR family NAD(P)-dependent oxidoreductase [uncultured Sphaerochaeta sp.]
MIDMNEMYSLEGRCAVVTGGSTGLGLATTRALVASGAKVLVLSFETKEQASEALAEFGDRVAFYQFDITDTDNTPALVETLIAEHGPITILVNNAGNHCKKPIEEMSVAEYQKVLDVHLVGAFALTKALVPHMKAQKLGSIIFMASMTSYIGQPAVAGYSTAKAGILGLVHTLATECGPENVRINAVAPGWIDTPMFHKATDNDPPRLNKILGRIPMNRVGDPMDIGMAVSFLSSEAARYINGICLPVDGGALIGF